MGGYRVLGDWGTSRMRLSRVEHGRVVARCEGPGIAMVAAGAQAAFADALAPWLADGLLEAACLCGMAGARGGWMEAPYADCPAGAADWMARAALFDWRGVPVAILAGLACVQEGMADVMRGEETQIFGALRLDPSLASGRHLMLLPGTHSKWAVVEDGRVIAFRTVPTGELFALLGRSTLGAGDAPVDEADETAGFAEGVDRARAGLPFASLFAARAQRLQGGRSAGWAKGYLSGLLIGEEIAEMRALYPADGVLLIGDARLTARYAQALAGRDVAVARLDGDACALAGLGLEGERA